MYSCICYIRICTDTDTRLAPLFPENMLVLCNSISNNARFILLRTVTEAVTADLPFSSVLHVSQYPDLKL